MKTLYRQLRELAFSPIMANTIQGDQWIQGGLQIQGGSPVGYVVGQSAVAVVSPADVTEDVLATVIIPAGALGANGFMLISSYWSCVNNANSKLARIRFSGAAGTAYMQFNIAASATLYDQCRLIANRGLTNSQVGHDSGIAFSSAGTPQTSAVDTLQQTSLVFSMQKAVGGDTVTLECFQVLLFPKA